MPGNTDGRMVKVDEAMKSDAAVASAEQIFSGDVRRRGSFLYSLFGTQRGEYGGKHTNRKTGEQIVEINIGS